jgi:predicted DsbA family dithiol-disulfide isomerase
MSTIREGRRKVWVERHLLKSAGKQERTFSNFVYPILRGARWSPPSDESAASTNRPGSLSINSYYSLVEGMFRWGVKLTGSSSLQTASVKRGSAIMASSRPKIETEVWSDLACPWCYVGCQRINKAVAKFGDKADVDITWHAFLLDRNYHSMHPDGEPLEPYYQAKFGKDAESIKKRLTDSGAPDGALFSNWTWRSSTFPGHRLVALGRAHGKSHATKEHLFKKIYEQGENISSIESLIQAGKDLGLPNVEEWMNSDKGMEEVLEDDTVAKTQ